MRESRTWLNVARRYWKCDACRNEGQEMDDAQPRLNTRTDQ